MGVKYCLLEAAHRPWTCPGLHAAACDACDEDDIWHGAGLHQQGTLHACRQVDMPAHRIATKVRRRQVFGYRAACTRNFLFASTSPAAPQPRRRWQHALDTDFNAHTAPTPPNMHQRHPTCTTPGLAQQSTPPAQTHPLDTPPGTAPPPKAQSTQSQSRWKTSNAHRRPSVQTPAKQTKSPAHALTNS